MSPATRRDARALVNGVAVHYLDGMRRARASVTAWVVLTALLMAAASAVVAQPLHVVGDGEHLWYVRDDKADGTGFTLLHRGAASADRFLHRVDSFRGRPVPGGVAAHGGALWLVFDDLSVQTIEAVPDVAAATLGGYQFGLSKYPSLPAGVMVRSMAAGGGGAFVLVRVETAEALRAIDAAGAGGGGDVGEGTGGPGGVPILDRFRDVPLPPGLGGGVGGEPSDGGASPQPDATPTPGVEPGASGAAEPGAGRAAPGEPTVEADPAVALEQAVELPPDVVGAEPTAAQREAAAESAPAEPSSTAAESEAEGGAMPGPGDARPASVSEPRLLRLGDNTWEKVDLPEGLTAEHRAWLVFHPDAAAWPSIVVAPPGDRNGELWVYRRVDSQWRRTIYPPAWPTHEPHHGGGNGAGDLRVAALGPTLVVGRAGGGESLRVDLLALAPEGPIPLGGVALDAAAPFRWTLVPFGASVAVVATPPRNAPTPNTARLQWARVGSDGQTLEAPAILYEHRRKPLDLAFDQFLLVGGLVVATVVMLVFWRRDPQWNQVELPATLTLADLPGRAFAAAIDLTPGVVAALFIFNTDVRTLLGNWPGLARTVGWEAYVPALTAIAIAAAHGTVAELFTGRSLGKAIVGLQVAGLRGEAPNLWQVLGRNALKVIELAQPLLLILPLLGPYRQRLGDLVARTLVVSSKLGKGKPREDKGDAAE